MASDTLVCGGRRLALNGPPLVMGVVNLTEDSFYAGSRTPSPEEAVRRALALAAEGADLLDLGAESTRPGARPVPDGEQLDRLLPVIREVCRRASAPISIDTRSAAVAAECLAAGAALVNDVSGFQADPAMAGLIARAGCPAVLMHMRGDPSTMQALAGYADVVSEVRAELAARVEAARAAGVRPEQIILDVGIGFAKTADHNFELLAHLGRFLELGYPLLVGPSRKSFVYRAAGVGPDGALAGTLAAVTACTLAGVHILRVHDVAPVRQAVLVGRRLKEHGWTAC